MEPWGNSVLLGQITFPNILDPVYLQGKVGEIMVRKSQDSRGFFKASALCVCVCLLVFGCSKRRHKANLEAQGRVEVRK